MQWEHCQGCQWSVPVGKLYCEVCTALLEGVTPCAVETARIYLKQRWRALGDGEMRARYSDAKNARRRFFDSEVWDDFLKRNIYEESPADMPVDQC